MISPVIRGTLGRQIIPHELLLSRPQIGLPPNLEYMHSNYRIISLLSKLLW